LWMQNAVKSGPRSAACIQAAVWQRRSDHER
jgi:hypothetical protein